MTKKQEELPRVEVSAPRQLPEGVIHQTIRIENIEQLYLILGNDAVLQATGAQLTIDRSMKAKNVGIQSQEGVHANHVNISIIESPTTTNKGFEEIISPLIEAINTATLSGNQSLLLNNYINLLRQEAAKPKETRDASGLKMILEGLKMGVSFVPMLSSVWNSVGAAVTNWFFG